MRFKIFGQPSSLWRKKNGPAGNFDCSWSIKHSLVTLPPFKVTSKERRKEENQGDLIDQKIIESFFLTVCEKLEEDLKVAENEAETLIVNQHMKLKLNGPENITVFH